MTAYKAFVRDRQTKQTMFITSENKNMDEFIADLHGNGYSIIEDKVKTAVEFDRILNETNSNDWDWHPNRPCYKGWMTK